MFWKKKTATENDIRTLVAKATDAPATVLLQGGHVLVTLEIDPASAATMEEQSRHIEKRIATLPGIASARVILTAERAPSSAPPAAPQKNPPVSLPDIKHIIAVASGKGGVGKSTVAANLAVALAQSGLRVGILDADIYGPSVPTLFGLRGQKPVQQDNKIEPLQAHGVAVMSIGLMLDETAPLVWRGPMVQSAILQLLRDVNWGVLDVLVLDMPPGTGDAQLTVAQKLSLSGAVIVSTPQDIALLDATKGIEMFRKVNVPILGLIENMSLFCCPNCGTQSAIFGNGGAQARAAEMKVPFLGALPLDPALRAASDAGTPLAGPEFQAIAKKITAALLSIIPASAKIQNSAE